MHHTRECIRVHVVDTRLLAHTDAQTWQASDQEARDRHTQYPPQRKSRHRYLHPGPSPAVVWQKMPPQGLQLELVGGPLAACWVAAAVQGSVVLGQDRRPKGPGQVWRRGEGEGVVVMEWARCILSIAQEPWAQAAVGHTIEGWRMGWNQEMWLLKTPTAHTPKEGNSSAGKNWQHL